LPDGFCWQRPMGSFRCHDWAAVSRRVAGADPPVQAWDFGSGVMRKSLYGLPELMDGQAPHCSLDVN
jgi:hypothetical protein